MCQPPAAERPVRVAFATLGCRLNQYDTEGMKAALPAAPPCVVVPWEAEADVYVLNSCTVTGKADQKCRQMARAVKRRAPQARVVVVGCYAQTQPDQVGGIAGVDAVIGNTAKDDPAAWLPAVLAAAERTPLVRVAPFVRRPPFRAPRIAQFSGHARAFVKVQDGCDLRCAYCVIWRARGPARSRPVAEVVAQAAALRAAGFHELVLAGVNLGSYGRDLGGRDGGGAGDGLAGLVAALLDAEPGLRVRLSSLHPNEATPALLSLLARSPRLRPHLHLSLQSGAETVLRRMRRPYRAEAARLVARAALATRPDCALGADVIVGFPGETDAEFAQTRDLLAELPLAYLHVFRFSLRPGTPAAAMPAQVAPSVVTERAEELRRLSRRLRRAFEARLSGSRREATVESGPAPAGWRPATADCYATVLVPASLPVGALVELTVAGRVQGHLCGTDVAVLEARPAPPADGGARAVADGWGEGGRQG